MANLPPSLVTTKAPLNKYKNAYPTKKCNYAKVLGL